EPKVERGPARDAIKIALKGSIGPKVNVKIEGYALSEKTQRTLLPVKREGSIDESAIEEGRRRLLNNLQEQGYFFADVAKSCSVTPSSNTTVAPGLNVTATAAQPSGNTNTKSNPNAASTGALSSSSSTVTATTQGDKNARLVQTDITNALSPQDAQGGANDTCAMLDPETLSGRTVNITYTVERGRRFR